MVLCYASFSTACEYGPAEHSFGYLQFDAHESSLIVPFPASLTEGASSVRFARLLTLYRSELATSLLAFKQSAKIDLIHSVGDELPFLGYISETWAVQDVVATRALKHSKVSGEVVVEVSGRGLASLKVIC